MLVFALSLTVDFRTLGERSSDKAERSSAVADYHHTLGLCPAPRVSRSNGGDVGDVRA
jgi:hypothetical protein